jgi:NADH dehydrogenase [ubiquinone] 1 alpha subcomplex assembly factor 5
MRRKLSLFSFQRRFKADAVNVFDRSLKQRQRVITSKFNDREYYDYLRKECNSRLVDRLDDINRAFPLAIELGSYAGELADLIAANSSIKSDQGGIGGIEKLIQCDASTFGVLSPHTEKLIPPLSLFEIGKKKLQDRVELVQFPCDEEYLPFEHNSVDLIMSSFDLHWVNKLPSTLKQIHQVLKPDGVFIGALLGGSTLQELKYSFYLAEQERKGGFSPHTSPMTLASDIAGLMQAANFALPTIDVDTITVCATLTNNSIDFF